MCDGRFIIAFGNGGSSGEEKRFDSHSDQLFESAFKLSERLDSFDVSPAISMFKTAKIGTRNAFEADSLEFGGLCPAF